MKGYTIQHSIDLLEKAVENDGGASTAADVSYDNSSSHLTADDVQEAIDELNTAIGQIDTGLNLSATEHEIGKWLDGRPIYERTITGEITPSGASYSVDVLDLATLGAEILVTCFGSIKNTGDGYSMLTNGYVNSGNATGFYLTSDGTLKLYIMGTYNEYTLHVFYVKPTPVSSTRKKSSKQEELK